MTARATFSSVVLLLILGAGHLAMAQAGNESRVHSDFRREAEELQPCRKFSFGNIASCGQELVTGQPLHIALGSLAPQNGFAAGLAFVEHKDFKDEWRMTVNTDAVATGNGSWRAGAYLKAYRLGGGKIIAVQGAGMPVKQTGPFLPCLAVIQRIRRNYFTQQNLFLWVGTEYIAEW